MSRYAMEQVCPFCLTAVGTEPSVQCPVCNSVHHADCFAEGSGCAVLGCSHDRTDVQSDQHPTPLVMAGALPAESRTGEASERTGPVGLRPPQGIAPAPEPAQPGWAYSAPVRVPVPPGAMSPHLPAAPPPPPSPPGFASFPHTEQPHAQPAAASARPARKPWGALAGAALAAILAFALGFGIASNSAGDSYDDGYQAGKSAGYSDGRSDGYSAGESAGKSAGYSNGRSDGYSAGKSDGYDEGYTAGQEDAPTPATSDSEGSTEPSAEGLSSGTVWVDELAYGTTDNDSVRHLQWALRDKGYADVEITGDYDDATDVAVRAWQESIGNQPDAAGESSLGQVQASRMFEDYPAIDVY